MSFQSGADIDSPGSSEVLEHGITSAGGPSRPSSSGSSSHQILKPAKGARSVFRGLPASKFWRNFPISTTILVFTAGASSFLTWLCLKGKEPGTDENKELSEMDKKMNETLEECRSSFETDKAAYKTEELEAEQEIYVYTMSAIHNFAYERYNKSIISKRETPTATVWLRMNNFMVSGNFNGTPEEDFVCVIHSVVARLTLEVATKDEEKSLKFFELKKESQDPLSCGIFDGLFTQFDIPRRKFEERANKFIDGFLAERYTPVFKKCFA